MADDDNNLTDLNTPTELSLEEFNDLLQQIPSLSYDECVTEFLDAARYGDLDVCKALLLKTSSILNATHPTTRNSALHMAAANGHVDICKLLLHQGANVTLTNASGNTALHWAATNAQTAVVQLLLTHKDTDVLQRNEFGRSALTEGFLSENEGVVQSLLEHESAAEERLLETTTNGEEQQQTVVHEFNLKGIQCKVRECVMAKSLDDAVLADDDTAEADTTGLGIWPASIVLAYWMTDYPIAKHMNSILELGAGCGLPSIVLSKRCSSSATTLIATDWNPAVVENLQYNLQLNTHNNKKCTLQASRMNWYDYSTWPVDQVDLLIGSDLIYTATIVPTLIGTIRRMLQPKGRFLYVAPANEPRDGHDLFLQDMQRVFDVTQRPAPASYTSSPLQDEEMSFLHFPTLQQEYILYEFRFKE